MKMRPGTIYREPFVNVGLLTKANQVDFELLGEFKNGDGKILSAGSWRAVMTGNGIELIGDDAPTGLIAPAHRFEPVADSSTFIIRGVTIGINFHWERKQDQQFEGSLCLKTDPAGTITAINEISVERYLNSVISSEMSAGANPELLKAHSVISRSWLLAQLAPWKRDRQKHLQITDLRDEAGEIIRWYDQESHTDFDVCADDHCQRYQGITKATSPGVFAAVKATSGMILSYSDELCDTRFSKSCGGMTESYTAAWQDVEVPYLPVKYDGETFPGEYGLPLSEEANAEKWILGAPPAYCNTTDRSLIDKILPDFDRETPDFFRWRVRVGQSELQDLLDRKLGIEFGGILRLEPVERGGSGRIVRLRIVGERLTRIIGKELEIRRALSPTHLYSSAFVVETEGNRDGAPAGFSLSGAGWGHGVGLCQIGAAIMAERGFGFRQILEHYYPGAGLRILYERGIGSE